MRIAAIVLAAGRGLRFGLNQTDTKLTIQHLGVPLVRRVVETAVGSRAVRVIVVTGHGHHRVAAALRGLEIDLVQNADYASGLASSINAGVGALGPDIEGALMMLGDMPLVTIATLDALIERFSETRDEIDAVVPTFEGKRGNPVLVGKSLFERLVMLRGDQGAKPILAASGRSIAFCQVSDRGILVDVDKPADLATLDK